MFTLAGYASDVAAQAFGLPVKTLTLFSFLES